MKDMKYKHTLRTICACLLMAMACAHAEARPQGNIKRGMSKKEVMDILGKPSDTGFDRYSEQWEYYLDYDGWKHDRYVYVVFDDAGRVTDFASYTLNDKGNDRWQTGKDNCNGGHRHNIPQRMRCMDKKSFDILKQKVHRAGFIERKLDLIEVACMGFGFTCSQCADLMADGSFDDHKMDILKAMAPRIVDPKNSYVIYKTFTFTSSQEKAEKILQKSMGHR